MPDGSSSEKEAIATPPRREPRSRASYALRTRVAMVALGFIPGLHLGAVVLLIALPLLGRASRCWAWAGLAMLYLLPPTVVRVTTLLRPLQQGRVDVDSGAFLLWWFTAQWQVLFNRLPWLEEMLRMIPGLYSLWMRLWGARVGRLVYWSPGVAVLDRPLVNIGSRVVFGAGVRLNGHLLLPDGPVMKLLLARIHIGDDALVGGYSLLLPGVRIEAGEVSAPLRVMRPFMHYQGGRRVREEPENESGATSDVANEGR